MICLKIDSARRLSRSVIGMNIQFIESGKFELRTLAIKEVTSSQTGQYIKEFVINVLQTYGINLSQIYSLTTDNGANYLCAVRLIAEGRNANDDDEDDCENDSKNRDHKSGMSGWLYGRATSSFE